METGTKKPWSRRRKVFAWVVIVIVGLIVLGAIVGEPPADKSVAEPADPPRAAKSEDATDKAAQARGDFERLYGKLLKAAKPCDEGNSAAADTMAAISDGNATVYDAYGQARSAQSACDAAASTLSQMEVPASLPKEQNGEAAKALGACKAAYLYRKDALGIMMEVLDGDAKPSTVERFKDLSKAAQTGILVCVGSLSQVGMAIGAKLPSEP